MRMIRLGGYLVYPHYGLGIEHYNRSIPGSLTPKGFYSPSPKVYSNVNKYFRNKPFRNKVVTILLSLSFSFLPFLLPLLRFQSQNLLSPSFQSHLNIHTSVPPPISNPTKYHPLVSSLSPVPEVHIPVYTLPTTTVTKSTNDTVSCSSTQKSPDSHTPSKTFLPPSNSFAKLKKKKRKTKATTKPKKLNSSKAGVSGLTSYPLGIGDGYTK